MYVDDLADCIIEGVKRFDDLPNIMNVGVGKDYTIKQYYEINVRNTI